MGIIVSTPVKVLVQIDDLNTGCGYCYRGNTVEDCIKYSSQMFFFQHKIRVHVANL